MIPPSRHRSHLRESSLMCARTRTYRATRTWHIIMNNLISIANHLHDSARARAQLHEYRNRNTANTPIQSESVCISFAAARDWEKIWSVLIQDRYFISIMHVRLPNSGLGALIQIYIYPHHKPSAHISGACSQIADCVCGCIVRTLFYACAMRAHTTLRTKWVPNGCATVRPSRRRALLI